LFIYPTRSNGHFSFIYKAYRKAYQLLSSKNIDCISVAAPRKTAMVGIPLSRKFNLPLQIHVMSDIINNTWYRRASKSNILREYMAKFFLRWAHGIRVSTTSEKNKLSKLYGKKRVFNVPFYIDFDSFKTDKMVKKVECFSKENNLDRLILFVGRIAKQKDIPTLIKAFSKLNKNTGLIIVGDGPEFSNIRSLVKNKNLSDRVLFTGKVPYKKIPQYYNSCDMFAITSVHEGTCMVLQEAAVSKLPVVATKFAGAKDAIENGKNGYLTDFRDVEGIADSINKIISSSDTLKEMGENNSRLIRKKFSKDKILHSYKQMWKKTIDNFQSSNK